MGTKPQSKEDQQFDLLRAETLDLVNSIEMARHDLSELRRGNATKQQWKLRSESMMKELRKEALELAIAFAELDATRRNVKWVEKPTWGQAK